MSIRRARIKIVGPLAVIALAVGTAVVTGACAGAAPHGASATAPGRPASDQASETGGGAANDPSRQAAATLPPLTAAQLAGQRVIYSYSGLTPPARLLWLISHGEAAGVIFFGQNITTHKQIAGVVAELDHAAKASTNPVRLPLLLMTDQEGGQVRRLRGQPVLSEKQIGESSDPEAQATRAGKGAGDNLKSVGMNTNLAPVLDVYRKAGNFIDEFGRSYSMNPSVVSRLGAKFITAQQQTGVIATAKHFPGLGAAAAGQDTDVEPVTLHLSLHAIRTKDEYPYKAAIAAGVKMVMVSWAVYPALDPARPAGLSPTIVQGELRERLGFQGVTITDALEAGALRPFGSIAHRSVLAAQAGMDLLLCASQRVGEGENALGALKTAYKNGTLNPTTFKAAVQQIISLRSSLGG